MDEKDTCACSCSKQEPAKPADVDFDESICSAEFPDGCTKTAKEQQE